jgi:rod shape-determining protein MreD
MRLLNWFMVLLGLALLASVALPRYLPEAARPDLFVIMVVFVLLRAETEEILPLCWVTGLAKDLLSAGPLGEYALLYLILAMVLVRIRSSVNAYFVTTYAGLGFATSFLTDSVYAWTCARVGLSLAPGASRALLTAALATGLAAPFLFWAFDGMGGWLRDSRRWRAAR